MMYFLLYIAIDVIPAMIILTPLLIFWQLKVCKRKKAGFIILLLFFTGYILSIFNITGIPEIGTFSPQFHVNFIPFATLNQYSFHSILNIFLFVPLGLLLPLLWKPFLKFRNTLLAGFGLSLFIEISQLLTIRITDIDDLIMNTLGAVIGYLIIRFCIHMNVIHPPISEEEPESKIKEFFIILGASLFMWIFILPFLQKLMLPLISRIPFITELFFPLRL